MTFNSPECEYLVSLLISAIKGTNIEKAPQEVDFTKLVEIARSQQVYSIISVILDKCNLPDEEKNKLVIYNQNELVRLLAMKNELEILESELNAAEIKFMLLKGSVLRDYYPQQKMRQMSDIDILYDYSKRSKLVKIMKSRGFRLTTTCENSDDFFKEPFYTFEWHRELFFEESSFCPHFDLWENATVDKTNSFKYIINPTEHFVYTICHMYKHYITNGCGIRFLCDIYLMLQNEKSIDISDAYDKLDKIGIYQFAVDAVELTNAVFDNKEASKNQQLMLDFMLSNGVYGNLVIDYSKKLEEFNGSKIKYIFRRFFPNAKKMKAEYRVLKKLPFLLPIFYVIRLFTKVRYNLDNAKNELKQIKKV